jgi:hypothetical protein
MVTEDVYRKGDFESLYCDCERSLDAEHCDVLLKNYGTVFRNFGTIGAPPLGVGPETTPYCFVVGGQ